MIIVPCRVARQFSTLLRRCSGSRSRDAPPFVAVQRDKDGLSLTATKGDVSLRWHQAGDYEPASLAFTADHLDVFASGRSNVVLEASGTQHAEARWQEGDAERKHRLPVVDPDRVGAFPEAAGKLVPQQPSFLAALAEAARTAARDNGRFALMRILLRGKAGQIVATDGKQLLVQTGFCLPWKDDVLVPAIPAFAAKELVASEVTVARSADHVLVTTGPWSFALRTAVNARYPSVDQVVPRAEPAARCVFDGGEVKNLIDAVVALPGGDDRDAPVTLDVSGGVTIRAAGEKPQVVRALRYKAEGNARVAFNRQYLLRALKLGLTTVELHGPDKPAVAKDGTRTYVWATLGDVDPPTTSHKPEPETETTMKPTNTHPPDESRNGDHQAVDLLAEAESIRDALHAAASRLSVLIGALRRHRRQSRAIKQAVASLNSIRNLEP